ncbi:MAG: hypothetical protein L0H63_11855 [Nitrococcus sp.]|nr:hypothetical protein [Nitrococcus sp.]
MARLDHGYVELDLAGESVTLKPTLDAMQKINRRFGSLRAAIEQLQGLDFEAVVFVIEVGAGRKDMAARVFEAGLTHVTARVCEFVLLLMNPSARAGGAAEEGKV